MRANGSVWSLYEQVHVALRLYTNTRKGKAQLKQEENKTSFSFAAQEQDTCAAGKERRGRNKEQFVLADRDERFSAFSWATFHQCKNPDPEQILASSKMAIVCPKCFMETEFSSEISSNWFSTEQKEKSSFWWKDYLASWAFIWWPCCSHHITSGPYLLIPG